MNTGETILLIEKKACDGLEMFTVTHGRLEMNFFSQDDAFTFSRGLLNGKGKTFKRAYSGPTQSLKHDMAEKKKAYIVGLCKKMPISVNDIVNAARNSSDPDIKKVPMGTWSGLTCTLHKHKKISFSHKTGQRCFYKGTGAEA